MEGVLKELLEKGFNLTSLEKTKLLLQEKISLVNLKTLLKDSDQGKQGIKEMEEIFSSLGILNKNIKPEFDITLARGLNYYTGAILEVVTNDVQIGSIGGGGRYDDLTGIFGMPGISGVGISFGLDRIYEVIEELGLFPESEGNFTKLLFCCMDEKALLYALPLAMQCREKDIRTEVYPAASKLKKQLDYANSKKISYAVIIGEEEMQTQKLTLKNLTTGEQSKLDIEGIILVVSGQ